MFFSYLFDVKIFFNLFMSIQFHFFLWFHFVLFIILLYFAYFMTLDVIVFIFIMFKYNAFYLFET